MVAGSDDLDSRAWYTKVAVDEIKAAALSYAMSERIRLRPCHRIPTHMGDFQARICGREALHGAWQETKAGSPTVFLAMVKQQLHPDTNAKHRLSCGYGITQCSIKPQLAQRLHALESGYQLVVVRFDGHGEAQIVFR